MNDEIFEGREIPIEEQVKIEERIVDIDPDKLQFYEKLRRQAKGWANQKTGNRVNKLSEYLFLLPDLFILICRVTIDKRVPLKHKLKLGGIIAYVMMPIDIIPDFIPVIGYIDDLVLVVMGLNLLLNETDKKVLEDNWSGEGDVLDLLQRISAVAERFLDRNIMRRIRNFMRSNRR